VAGAGIEAERQCRTAESKRAALASSGDIGQSTVQKRCIIFLVSLNGAEFPMRNQRRSASPPTAVNCTVRKYLTARQIEKLMDHARKHSRYGHRDSTMILVAYRQGLRASEMCERLGKAARMPFQLHPHMLRHACGISGEISVDWRPSPVPRIGTGTVWRISNELGCACGRCDPPVGGTFGF
jgi:hypothetical protein